MTNYWILVASKNHVKTSVAGGFAQSAHGKTHPLRRMKEGDGVIYYSPKIEYGGKDICQAFTAIGCVVGEEIFKIDLGNNTAPARRKVQYLSCRDASITPLIKRLSFIKDKERWGNIFKFGVIHIPTEDFAMIATAMHANIR